MDVIGKVCKDCGVFKPFSELSKDKNCSHGVKALCKVCDAIRVKKRESLDPEKHKLRKRLAAQEWRKKNPEKTKQDKKDYAKLNKEKTLRYAAVWRKNNPEKRKVSQHRYFARKRSLPDNFTTEQWIACLEYHHYCCAVCGCQLQDLFGEVQVHADHWIPLSSEECLGTVAKNMICLCNSCNVSKGAKSAVGWLAEKYSTRKANEILKRVQTYFDSLPAIVITEGKAA